MEYATIARTALHYVGARFTDKITDRRSLRKLFLPEAVQGAHGHAFVINFCRSGAQNEVKRCMPREDGCVPMTVISQKTCGSGWL